MAEREPGPYWVKQGAEWTIAEWRDPFPNEPASEDWPKGYWTEFGSDITRQDGYFDEIGERAERTPQRPLSMEVTLLAASLTANLARYGCVSVGPHEWRLILRGLQAWPDPQPITDAQKTGKEFLLWDPKWQSWDKGHWSEGHWSGGKGVWMFPENYAEENEITHYLPLPPDVKDVEKGDG